MEGPGEYVAERRSEPRCGGDSESGKNGVNRGGGRGGACFVVCALWLNVEVAVEVGAGE